MTAESPSDDDRARKLPAKRGDLPTQPDAPEAPDPDAPWEAGKSGGIGRDAIWHVSRDCFAIIDHSGLLIDVNPAWTRALGWPLEQIVGKRLTSFVRPGDIESLAASLDAVSADGATAEFELRLSTRDGSSRLLGWSIANINGQLVCTGRDITDERGREIALDDSRDFARLALSAVRGVGVWTYEVSSDCFFCDTAISDLYGIDAQQAALGIKRTGFLANVHPDDLAALRDTMSGGLIHSGDLELEYRICHPDGSTRWVLSRGNTYFNDEGVPVRRTGVGIDMTSQRELEQQLRQSQKMEAVGHLTGGLAHDFNNMLQGVIGPLELIRKLVAMGRVTELDRFIGMAMSSAHRAAALTHRLLAFSRRQPLAPTSVNVREVIPLLEDLIRQTANENIALLFDTDAQPCLVRCDKNQLESALLNLAINACDAMPDGGQLTISASHMQVSEVDAQALDGARVGNYVRIAVADTGSGMPPDVARQVFEPFFTTKPFGRGTGLGLSMVYGFVGQSGGFVTLETGVGAGTTVCLYLPENLQRDEAEPASQPADRTLANGAGKTILVVDDDETVRQLLGVLFTQYGYEIITAHDGPSGLAILQSAATIDLLVTDVGLPGINGKQMADAARLDRPLLPVLFMTGYAEVATADGYLDARMGMLAKPFSLDSMIARTREMLRP